MKDCTTEKCIKKNNSYEKPVWQPPPMPTKATWLVGGTVAHANFSYQKQTLPNLDLSIKRNLERQLPMLNALIRISIKIL